MRIVVTGANGMLGTDIVAHLRHVGHDVVSMTPDDVDFLSGSRGIKTAIDRVRPFDGMINCAAYTDVDGAESHADEANSINRDAVAALGEICWNSRLFVHFSTDFVFDGRSSRPYLETDQPSPLGVYGRSKLAGERGLKGHPTAVVLRTAWLYGPNGRSFPRTILERSREGRSLSVITDQTGSPTYTLHLAQRVEQVLRVGLAPGIYHATGPDAMTRYEWAIATLRAAGVQSPQVVESTTKDWPTPAARPAFSVLDGSKLQRAGIEAMPAAAEGLAEFVRRLGG